MPRPDLRLSWLLFLLVVGLPLQVGAEPPLTYCANVQNAAALHGDSQYADLRLKVYATRVAGDAYALTGMGSNTHGDFAAITGTAALVGGTWRISLLGTLQTTDGRGYYILSGMIDLVGQRGTAFVGNVDVSFHGADDYNKPPENPQAGMVEVVSCEGFLLTSSLGGE